MDDSVHILLKKLTRASIGVPLLVIMILMMMVLPLPSILLDIFFTFSISLALIVILAVIYTDRPLHFNVFPTILLVATLYRLALNVASTRVVLLNGHNGSQAAGQVIQSFGEVVIGGNYAVGMVVFAILVIINFVVVTKGSTRISEVTARFTLDAMPGKQMAIDADLNAGLISQEEAKKRREEVTQEADFYGAMDGASKFVRGDAIAGILILFINFLGGLIIGTTQYHMTFADALHNYAILTIGDGLVAQVPSLLLSTAAAIMVTRVSHATDMGNQILTQLLQSPRALIITAGIVGALGSIPGMPHFAFLSLAMAMAAGSYLIEKKRKETVVTDQQSDVATAPEVENRDLDWSDVDPVDTIGLEIGYKLIHLVDKKRDGQLMGRIKGIRKKLSQDLGFLLPSVHIRDNLDLTPTTYRIALMGVTVGQGDLITDKELAINPGQVFGQLDGINCQDPAFGLDAVWIKPEQREHAQSLGYTVVDPSTIIATHLNHIMREHAAELLGHDEVQKLLDKLSVISPKLVESLVPNALPLSTIVKVLQRLLEDKIPVFDIRSIAECLVETAPKSQEPDVLVTAVRMTLKRLLYQTINSNNHELSAITLDPELEQILQQSLQLVADNGIGLEPNLATKLHSALNNYEKEQNVAGKPAVLLVSPHIRQPLARMLRHSIPNLFVLSYQEVPDEKQVKIIGSIGK